MSAEIPQAPHHQKSVVDLKPFEAAKFQVQAALIGLWIENRRRAGAQEDQVTLEIEWSQLYSDAFRSFFETHPKMVAQAYHGGDLKGGVGFQMLIQEHLDKVVTQTKKRAA